MRDYGLGFRVQGVKVRVGDWGPSAWYCRRAGHDLEIFALMVPLAYRGTLNMRKRPPLGPCSRAMHRALWWSSGVGAFL